MHGAELWRSDGTAAGTSMVLDLNPNTSPFGALSGLHELARLGSMLLMTADDGSHGRELWISDGTAAGTAMLVDIRPGTAGSEPDHFVAVGSTMFFTASDGVHGRELWRTDGTAAGTSMVADLQTGAPSRALTSATGWIEPPRRWKKTARVCPSGSRSRPDPTGRTSASR